MDRINVGCGSSPTEGWRNFDNSPSLWLARNGGVLPLLKVLKLLNDHQLQYIEFARTSRISWADATKRLPLQSSSADVVYSSHMLEHFDRLEATLFLQEAYRVLCSGGILRIGVPSLELLVEGYLQRKDADDFIERLYMSVPKPRSTKEKVIRLLLGERQHHWMYDAASLSRFVTSLGFVDAAEVCAGQTLIPDPGPLDLFERADETLFLEARKP